MPAVCGIIPDFHRLFVEVSGLRAGYHKSRAGMGTAPVSIYRRRRLS